MRGDFAQATAALDELVAEGRVFESPGPAIQFIAAAYRELVTALRDPEQLDPARLHQMIGGLRAGRLDVFLLGPACALAEACATLGDAALARSAEELLESVDERGIVFSVGGVFLVPRVIGRCVAAARRFGDAETWFERAIGIARQSGARVELARALLDRAQLRWTRSHSAEAARRAARDLDESIPILEELALRPALRGAHLLRQATQTRS